LRILIAEDEAATRVLLESRLSQWGFDPVSVPNGLEAWEALRRGDGPKLALVDRMMPGMEGAELCRRIRQKEKDGDTYTYMILVTAKGSVEHVVEGLDAGADDYLVKPFHEEELRARVRAGRRIVRLQDQLMKANVALSVQATTDPLTGVLNRRGILSKLEGELNRAGRSKKHLSLILFDLDGFKKTNDEFGHLAGDAVLKACVQRIGEVTRPYDWLGRWGGDEFLILLPGTNEEAAMEICGRIQEVVTEHPAEFEGISIGMSVSQGVAEVALEGTVDEVLDLADRALMKAKEAGGGGVNGAGG